MNPILHNLDYSNTIQNLLRLRKCTEDMKMYQHTHLHTHTPHLHTRAQRQGVNQTTGRAVRMTNDAPNPEPFLKICRQSRERGTHQSCLLLHLLPNTHTHTHTHIYTHTFTHIVFQSVALALLQKKKKNKRRRKCNIWHTPLPRRCVDCNSIILHRYSSSRVLVSGSKV